MLSFHLKKYYSSERVGDLRFKIEIMMLLAAIVLLTIGTFCYTYIAGDLNLALGSFPYRAYAVPFASFGSMLMALATVSYTKRSKNTP